MRLVYKLALLLIAAAVVPLATAGFYLISRNQHNAEG